MENTDIQKVENVIEVLADTRVECYRCGEMVEADDAQSYGSDDYCTHCYDEEVTSCYECGDEILRDDAYSHSYGSLCRFCENNQDESEDEDGFYIPSRNYSLRDLPQFQNKEHGEFITSDRIFSAELECYAPDSRAATDVYNELPTEFGMSGDGSLNNNGVEFQTPKLQGKAGEESIKLISRLLNAKGFTTDRSAGLHIHLDGAGLIPKTRTRETPREIANMLTFYLSFEDVMLSFLPPSRRNNQYCKAMRNDYGIREIRQAKNLEELEKIWYRVRTRVMLNSEKAHKYHSSRYAGINLHSLLKDGHLEVRFHSGTLNATKILEWVNLHQTILDKSVASWGNSFALDSMAAVNIPNLREKTELFFNLLALPQRAREYFINRQNTFRSTDTDNSEGVALNEVCAG
jgi:hypothetical protein